MLRTYFAGLFRLTSLIILLILVVASIVLWFFGGSVSIAGFAPFEPRSARIYTIAGLFVAYFLITFLRHVLARRANSRLINSMLANDELVSMGNDLSNDEIELIRERFEQTLKTLRDNPVDGRKSSNYLFELPWYIIIGPPGTGKTTILRNSGLDFPFAAEGHAAMQGIGGTRNCDWWISNEAVMIDTAGRYTTQDVNQGIDAATWGGFLDLLKQHRRRRPINGVLLAVSIADVALASEHERTRQAEILRQRLRELHRAFSVRLPVYVLFTKCDLIAGFEEFFDDADETEREQAWGITFPYDDEQMTFGPLFETGFVDLVARLEHRLTSKLSAERNNGRRCRIYSFPLEFGSLGPMLRGFISDVFRVNRYEAQPLLRGVYFTSGTQEGTPFDRLLGAMSRSFSLAPARQLPMSGQGKAFFIKRFLTDILFAEQNLVGKNARLERRLAALYTAGYAAVIAVTVGLAAYWLGGLSHAMEEIETAEAAADRLMARLHEANQDRSLATMLPALDAARQLDQAVALPAGWRLAGFMSIDARPTLSPLANDTYDEVLKDYLLPTLVSRLEAQIQLLSDSADTNSLLLREQLETYLMLTSGENYSGTRVAKEFQEEAEAVFPLSPDRRERMLSHMRRLETLLPAAVYASQPTIQAARSRITEIPQADDIYARMVSDSELLYQLPPISIVSILGAGILRADSATLGGTNLIPGLYTRSGFYDFFLMRLPEYIRNSTGSDWVLGDEAMRSDTYNQLAEQIVALYTSKYIETWRGAIDQVQVIDFGTLGRDQLVLRELSGPQSPLTKLLTVLRRNTELPLPSVKNDEANPGTGGAAGQVASAVAPTGLAGSALSSASDALQKTALSTAFGNAPWPGTTIAEAFRPLTSLVDPQNPGGSLDTVQQLFGDLYGTVSSVATAPQPEAAAFELVAQRAKSPTNDAMTRLRAEAVTKPEPVRQMVAFVADRTWQLLMKLSLEYVNAIWQQEVVPACNAIMTDRYPFSPGSREEVALQDFADLFKPAGVIDSYFTTYLSPFVSVRGRQLVVTPVQGAGIGISQEALAQFSRARLIRDAFFGQAGTTPEAKFTVEPTYLAPNALRSTFTLDDSEIVYRHGPVRAQDFVWPSKLDASVARLRITLLDGRSDTVERSGTWAIFRLLNASGLSSARGQDQFGFSIELDGARASYRLQAGSVTNPFNLGLYSSFRCPPAI